VVNIEPEVARNFTWAVLEMEDDNFWHLGGVTRWNSQFLIHTWKFIAIILCCFTFVPLCCFGYPCSYICNCLKIPKSPKLTNIVIHIVYLFILNIFRQCNNQLIVKDSHIPNEFLYIEKCIDGTAHMIEVIKKSRSWKYLQFYLNTSSMPQSLQRQSWYIATVFVIVCSHIMITNNYTPILPN